MIDSIDQPLAQALIASAAKDFLCVLRLSTMAANEQRRMNGETVDEENPDDSLDLDDYPASAIPPTPSSHSTHSTLHNTRKSGQQSDSRLRNGESRTSALVSTSSSGHIHLPTTLSLLLQCQCPPLLLTSAGFLADAYDLLCINMVVLVLDCQMALQDSPSSPLDSAAHSAGHALISSSALLGAIVGQLSFGYLADRFGRRRCYLATLTLCVIGSLGSATSTPLSSSSPSSLYILLSFWRCILGVGVGGEYPLTAAVSVESGGREEEGRGKRLGLVFSMQGIGSFLAPLIMLLLLSTPLTLDATWRIALAVGALPGLLLFLGRYRMTETRAYTRSSRVPFSLSQLRPHARNLSFTMFSWLIFDIVFYANSLFSAELLSQEIEPTLASQSEAQSYLRGIAATTLLLATLALPGFYLALSLIDRVGRRRLQMLGFGCLAGLYTLSSLLFFVLDLTTSGMRTLLFALYGLSFCAANLSNVSTYVIPAELFPTALRARAHGLSAAAGKVGALIGASGMAYLLPTIGVPGVLLLCSIISVGGYILTYAMCPETMGVDVLGERGDGNGGEVEMTMDGHALMHAEQPIQSHEHDAIESELQLQDEQAEQKRENGETGKRPSNDADQHDEMHSIPSSSPIARSHAGQKYISLHVQNSTEMAMEEREMEEEMRRMEILERQQQDQV